MTDQIDPAPPLNNHQAACALLLHVGIDIKGNLDRLALQQRVDGPTRCNDMGFGKYQYSVECAKSGNALWYCPKQHVAIGWQVGKEITGILVRAEISEP